MCWAREDGIADDGSAVFHDTKLGSDAIEHARRVDVHDKFPVLIRLLHDGIDSDDAGPVGGTIQPSKLVDGLGDPGVHGGALAHIDLSGEVRRRVFQRMDRLGQALLVHIGQRDKCSSLGQQLGKDAALARPCSRDRDLSLCKVSRDWLFPRP